MNHVHGYLNALLERGSNFDPQLPEIAELGEWLRPRTAFLRELWRDPGSVGAVCPSSRQLAERIAGWVDVSSDGWVVELGGGTGAVTAALLRRGVPRERLIVVERSRHFTDHLRARFPHVRVFHGDASDVGSAVGGPGSVNAIVSGLPLRSLPASAVQAIVRACAEILDSSGRVIQFTYALRAPSAWRAAELQRVADETVWRNLPPARIEVFAPPRSAGLPPI